jgi:hypothetical protein
MHLGDCWITVDGEQFWEYLFDPTVTGRRGILSDFAQKIYNKYERKSDSIEWKHEGVSRCSWGKVIRRNTDKTIDEAKTWTNELCATCRGKGHPWKCDIWNGRPFLVPEGQRMPKGAHWKNPDWCKACGGSGEA